ncbi:PREDICTED: odorant receptor 22c-like [Nicrophorus vespilloides]|uniref:Odorant receptor n=1 Tax=Nicrophorus vespilloides TaxID=110193 RepID=A0ABM1MFM4_NICVS|nr:PREDICTED: odorant receptor 22c-like [Nicrophorus vespilloides]
MTVTKNVALANMGLKTLGYVGLNAHSYNFGYGISVFVSLLRVVYVVLIVLLVAENYNNIDVIMDAAEAFSSYMQGGTKLVVILFYLPNMSWLVNQVEHFWEDLPNSKKDEYKLWFRAFPIYERTFFVTLTLLYVRSIVSKDLVFVCKIPDFPHAFAILLIGQYFAFTCDCIYVVGLDVFFMSLCILIKRQFMLIRDALLLLDDETNEAKIAANLKNCIKHHIFLLEYTTFFSETFKSALLLQYLLSTYSICIQLFILTERNTIPAVATSCFYMICVSIQLALYCFPADDLSEVASEVSNFIYSTKWYNNSNHLQKYIPTIICRSQKAPYFTAGGMIFINKAAFTTVFKSGLSFYTAVKNFKN